MNKYDVVVVGAGPAGSTAAKNLAELGIKVLLIDKETFPRDKPCGGGLPQWVLNRFSYINDLDVIESHCYGGYIHSPSGKYSALSVQNNPSVAMVLREKFDTALVNLAKDTGASVTQGKKVIDIKVRSEKARVCLVDGSHVDADLVIGADGYWSAVARKTGLHTHDKYMGIGVAEEFPVKPKIIEEYFTDRRLSHMHIKTQGILGYGWVFPKQNHINIGLGEYRIEGKANEPRNLRDAFSGYVQLLKKNKVIPSDLKSKRLRGGAIPAWPSDKTYTDRVLLCGDAAGFIDPITGEGIYYALASAGLVTKIALQACENQDFSEAFLKNYQTVWKQDFGRDIIDMLKSTKQWQGETETFVKLLSKDKKLAGMVLQVFSGQVSICDIKWKMASRYLYVRLKDILRLLDR